MLGGYSLNGAPEQIHLARIVRLFDGAIALLPCATFDFYERCDECSDEDTCDLRQVAIEIRNETVSRLKRATLASFMEREAQLVKK